MGIDLVMHTNYGVLIFICYCNWCHQAQAVPPFWQVMLVVELARNGDLRRYLKELRNA